MKAALLGPRASRARPGRVGDVAILRKRAGRPRSQEGSLHDLDFPAMKEERVRNPAGRLPRK